MLGISSGRIPVPVDSLQFHQKFSYENPASDLIIDQDIIVSDDQIVEVIGRTITVAADIRIRGKEIYMIHTSPTKKLNCLGAFVCDMLATNADETFAHEVTYINGPGFYHRWYSQDDMADYAKGRSFESYFPKLGTVVEWDFE